MKIINSKVVVIPTVKEEHGMTVEERRYFLQHELEDGSIVMLPVYNLTLPEPKPVEPEEEEEADEEEEEEEESNDDEEEVEEEAPVKPKKTLI